MFSIKDYQRLEAVEDKLWDILAKTSEIEGLIGEKESEAFLQQLFNPKGK